jgi:hypothetical protein
MALLAVACSRPARKTLIAQAGCAFRAVLSPSGADCGTWRTPVPDGSQTFLSCRNLWAVFRRLRLYPVLNRGTRPLLADLGRLTVIVWPGSLGASDRTTKEPELPEPGETPREKQRANSDGAGRRRVVVGSECRRTRYRLRVSDRARPDPCPNGFRKPGSCRNRHRHFRDTHQLRRGRCFVATPEWSALPEVVRSWI